MSPPTWEAIECERLRAVVAAQREALRKIAACANKPYCGDCYQIAQEALDAEGVSEPGAVASQIGAGVANTRAQDSSSPGSLTSPVDTPPGAKP